MSFLVLDLETIPDASIKPPEPKKCSHLGTDELQGGIVIKHSRPPHTFLLTGSTCLTCGAPAEEFLSPPYHRIVAIGLAIVTDNYKLESVEVLNAHVNEAEALRTVTEYLDAFRSTTLVGYNSRSFDAPVLAARCFALGVPFPWYYRSEARFRYKLTSHIDLLDTLCDFGAAPRARLDAVAQSMGLPGKVGIDGSMVAGMVAEGKIAEVLAYCACDVLQETAVFLRLQFLRGVLTLKEYQAAIDSWWQWVGRDGLGIELLKSEIQWDRVLLKREDV